MSQGVSRAAIYTWLSRYRMSKVASQYCRQHVTHCHEKGNIRNKKQSEIEHTKCKRLTFSGGQAYECSSDWVVVMTWDDLEQARSALQSPDWQRLRGVYVILVFKPLDAAF
jgi:hypothetical protein